MIHSVILDICSILCTLSVIDIGKSLIDIRNKMYNKDK